MGAKEALLVFRTSVLSENATNLINNDLNLELSSSTSSAEDFGLVLPVVVQRGMRRGDKERLPDITAMRGSANHNQLQQQTKENKSDNPSEPRNNFKLSLKASNPTTTTDRSDMPAALLNVQYRFICTESRLLRKILHSHGIRESEDEQLFNVLWSGSHLKPDVLRNLAPYQRVNHFPR